MKKTIAWDVGRHEMWGGKGCGDGNTWDGGKWGRKDVGMHRMWDVRMQHVIMCRSGDAGIHKLWRIRRMWRMEGIWG